MRSLGIASGAILAASGAAGISDPTKIPNLIFWLRADLGVTTGATFTWADQSSSGFNVVQSTAGQQPAKTVGAGPLGGAQPGIVFTSASNNVLVDATAGIVPATTWSAFFVWQTNSTATAQIGLCAGSTGANGWGFGVNVGNAGKRTLTAFGAGAATFGNCTTAYEKWSIVNNASSQSARVNGGGVALSVSNIVGLTPNASSAVGGLGGAPTDPWGGTMWEIAVYGRALTGQEVLLFEAYQHAQTGL